MRARTRQGARARVRDHRAKDPWHQRDVRERGMDRIGYAGEGARTHSRVIGSAPVQREWGLSLQRAIESDHQNRRRGAEGQQENGLGFAPRLRVRRIRVRSARNRH